MPDQEDEHRTNSIRDAHLTVSTTSDPKSYTETDNWPRERQRLMTDSWQSDEKVSNDMFPGLGLKLLALSTLSLRCDVVAVPSKFMVPGLYEV